MKNLFRNLFAVCILATLSLFITTPKGEAADYYSTIYNQVSSANGNPTEDDWITNAILYASSSYQVDPFLITSVMEAESGFDINVGYSRVGAIGLMQLMPDTARSVGVDPYDPLQNVLGGTIYLSTCLNDFDSWGDYGVTYAVAAYNAGPNAVYSYQGVPPYPETIEYVNRVANYYQELLDYSENY